MLKIVTGTELWLAPEHRGKGYGAETLAAQAEYCFNELGATEIYDIIYNNNTASRAMAQRAGYLPCDTLNDESTNFKLTRQRFLQSQQKSK
jgi:RimJ/RimL family protein N-acetyltransferase